MNNGRYGNFPSGTTASIQNVHPSGEQTSILNCYKAYGRIYTFTGLYFHMYL